MASFHNLRLLAFLLSLLLFGVLSSAVQNQMFRVVAIDKSSAKDITNTGISKQNQLTTRSMDNFTSDIIPKQSVLTDSSNKSLSGELSSSLGFKGIKIEKNTNANAISTSHVANVTKNTIEPLINSNAISTSHVANVTKNPSESGPNTNSATISHGNITTPGATPVEGVNILNTNTNASAGQPLLSQQETGGAPGSINQSSMAQIDSDTLDQTTPPEVSLGQQVSNETETAGSILAGISTSNANIENNNITSIQNVINDIAIGAAQSGGNSQNVASQISNEIVKNPKGSVANAIKELATQISRGNVDELNIATKQIGSLIAKGNNIQQTLVQVTNNIVNNIETIKSTENNFDRVIIHQSTPSDQKTLITGTLDVIKNAKQEVDVPRVHIKFHGHERSLVLSFLTTNNYKYEMPFSKYNGAFTLDDNDFMVKLLSGDGNIQAASVAPMFTSGEIGERMFLDKEVNQGNVFFSMKGVDSGTYLLEVYVKLSNGSIGTFARGSVTVI